MKISFNPSNSNKNILDLIKNNKDIIFDLKGHSIFARGVEFKGTDTNTWRDIKINNVSIGSNILDLRNGSNTTLTNTNGVVTINSTWRPVVDNLTSDSTTSSLSAKQGKVLKALIDGKSNSDHNHDDRYLKLTGGTMASNALITFADSGSQGTDKGPQGARGGLYWTGQSDYAKLYAEETVGDNLDLVIQFGDDNSNGLSIRNKANTQTSYISSSGVITTGTFKGNLDWSYITNKPATATRWPSWAEVTGKPSSFTPSTHTHGLSNSVFFLNMPSINGNAKWKEVFGYPVNYNLLLSVRINNPAPEWCVGNFGSGILYGGSDTKGFMSSAYNEPFIMWAGGNGSSDDSVPKWYIGIKGTHKSIYNLATIASEANAAYNLRHSHANKSVLDGITSALVNSWNTAYNFVSNITGTDTDKVINKWEEIVNFLAGISEDNKLNTLLNSKLSIQQLSAKDILTTKTNNALFWVDTKGNASTITTGPFTDHPYALLSVTNYNQNAENHKFFYRSRLAFSSAGDIKVASCHHEFEYQQDETWYNVLTSKNSGINGSTIKLNGTSITVYSSGTADGRYVKKSGDTMSGVLTIDTTNFGALTIKRNDDANGASIQFRGKSSVYGYIGLNNSTKDKQFLRWSSDTSRIYTILDTSSTYISNGKGVINGTTITQVDNATNSTNSTNARKLVNWYSARPTSLNAQFGDGSLRIFYATSSTTEGKPAEDSHILHLAWDNTGGYDAQLAVHARSGKVSTRAQNGGTWQPWKTLAFITDIPTSLKNPYSFNVFGVVYDGSAAKTVTTSNFISQVNEGTATITDGTMLITSYASNSGFADTNAVNVPYKRKAIHLWEYIKAKTDSLYATKVHNHDGSGSGLDADTLDGYHAASFVKMKQFRFNQYKEGFWTKILTITINSTSDLQPVIAFNWIPSECAREVWAEFTINWRSNSPIFYAIWKGTAVRTLTCVNSSGNIWNVWVQGDKNSYDPFGEVQVTYAHNISSYNGGSLGYSDSDPGGTRCTLGGYVNYARSTGNADTVDGQHASAFSYKSWWHWYGKDGQPNWLWGGNNENDYYVYNPSNFRVAYASSAGNADTLDGYPANGSNDRPYGHIPTIESDGVMEVGRYIDFHNDNNGKHDFSTRLQSTGNYGNEVNLPSASGTLALINDVNNYYWANVKISASSSTTTSPTVHTLTATRVCAGHNPGIDNSISCSNWFRSSGNTGWYNTTYYGGWYMSDTSWIRAHNGVGIYTSGQIYSSSSIRMSNILLEHTDEINNSANGGIHLNYRNSGNVSLCYGGGNVGIGTTTPSYKLDVNGQMRASGFHHSSVNSDNYILLAGGGYKSFGGDDSTPIFLGCLDLYRGGDGTISSSFYCLGYSVPFTYTRGGNYCKIVIPDTTRLSFYIIAAIASVNYSGGGMDTWVGNHRGDGAWWLHCQAFGWNEVRVKGFRLANGHNNSWWGGNPLYSDNGGANKITVCIFGHVKYK